MPTCLRTDFARVVIDQSRLCKKLAMQKQLYITTSVLQTKKKNIVMITIKQMAEQNDSESPPNVQRLGKLVKYKCRRIEIDLRLVIQMLQTFVMLVLSHLPVPRVPTVVLKLEFRHVLEWRGMVFESHVARHIGCRKLQP